MTKNLLFGLVLLLLVGCGQMNETPDPSPTVARTTVVTGTSTPMASATANPTQTSTEIFTGIKYLSEEEPLGKSGPWLLINVDNGFIFISQNGTEERFLPNPPSEYTYTTATAAPEGGLVAIVYSGRSRSEIILNIFSVPESKVLYSQNLLSYEVELPENFSPHEMIALEEDRHWAVGKSAWSSDGKQLAFVSSHLGPTPDVYLYDVETGTVEQLTSGPAYATNLSWSPDNKYIFHAGVDKMFIGYSGSGYKGWNFYADRADGSGVIYLGSGLTDKYRGTEKVIGWVSNNEVLIESNYSPCAETVLWSINIESGRQKHIGPKYFSMDIISPYDPINKTTLVWEFNGFCQGSFESIGLYKISSLNGRREKIVTIGEASGLPAKWDEDYENFRIHIMYWSDNGGHFVLQIGDLVTNTSTWVTLTSNGEVETYEAQPVFAPDGETYAIVNNAANIVEIHTPDGSIHLLDYGGIRVKYPMWSPDGTFFYFTYQEDYDDPYLLFSWNTSLETQSIFIHEEGPYFEPVWVMP